MKRQPGLHLRGIERAAGIPLSTVRYHLDELVRHRLLEAEEDRNVIRYYPAGMEEAGDRRWLGALRQRALRRVVVLLLSSEDATLPYQDILAASGLGSSTLAVHLKELQRRGMVERVTTGRGSRYALVEPDRTLRLLVEHRETLLDRMVDGLLAALYDEDAPP